MNYFSICINKKNKFVYLILFLLFTLLSTYMPHGSIELHENYNFEDLFTYNNKQLIKLRKLFNKLRALIIKIFKLSQILRNSVVKINTTLKILFNITFSMVTILHLLRFDFHGGKYKSRHAVS